MNPAQFNAEVAPGRLVRAEFVRIALEKGQPVQQHEKGWAFVPSSPPKLELILANRAGEMLELNDRAVAALGRLDGFFTQSPGGFNIDPWVLYRPLRLREARLSSRIENTIASSVEVDEADLITPKRSEPIEVNNYLMAIEMGAKSSMPITESLIRQLHAQLLKGLPRSEIHYPGKYRPNQVMIGDESRPFSDAKFVPPPPVEVPALMTEFVEYVRKPHPGTPALFASAIAHYQFETIHPFSDGNGRLGRLLVTLSLCGGSLLSSPLIYPSGYIDQNKSMYYDRLLKVSTEGDWASWIVYFLTAILSEAENTQNRMSRLFKLREEYLSRVAGRSLGGRFIAAIDSIFLQSIVTIKRLHKNIGGTEQTARNYVDIMVENGILKILKKSGRQNIYYAHEIFALADED